VILNDLKDPSPVAQEITCAGGKAYVLIGSVSEGERIAREAIRMCGRVDIVVNNAGFIRDKSIANMTVDMWDSVVDVHLTGTFKIIMALWPHFLRQGHGRVVNISSPVGVYGNFGQSNYSLAVSKK
jgi:multifunctional beta-oxidation protein